MRLYLLNLLMVVVYNKGFVISGGSYFTTITIPSKQKNIKLNHSGTEINIPVSGNEITYKFS